MPLDGDDRAPSAWFTCLVLTLVLFWVGRVEEEKRTGMSRTEQLCRESQNQRGNIYQKKKKKFNFTPCSVQAVTGIVEMLKVEKRSVPA